MSDENKDLAKAVRELAKAHAVGFDKLSEAISSLSYNVKQLGNAGAATDMGAIENLSLQIQEGASSIASALGRIANRPMD